MGSVKEVLLLKKLPKLGSEGERVHVRAGYFRNYLGPNKLAIAVGQANRKQIEALVAARERREKAEKEAAEAIAQKIASVRIVVSVKTGEKGKLFGSVTAPDILARLEEQGLTIERDQLKLLHPIKTLGQHQLTVQLHAEVEATFALEVVSENPVVSNNKA